MKQILFVALLFCSVRSISAQTVTCSGQVGPTGGSTSATSGSWTSYVYGVSNAATVYFATWSIEDGQDDIVWYHADPIPGTNNYQASINLANHRSGDADYGQIAVQVWAYSSNWTGTFCGDASFERVPSGPATASSVVVPQSTVFATPPSTLDFHACGVTNARVVLFPTWTDANQDDIVWYQGDKVWNDPACSPNTWSWKATMNFANHKPSAPNYGSVCTSIWAYDQPYSDSWLGGNCFPWQPAFPLMPDVTVQSPDPHGILNDGVTRATFTGCLTYPNTKICDDSRSATHMSNCRVQIPEAPPAAALNDPNVSVTVGPANDGYPSDFNATFLATSSAIPGARWLTCTYTAGSPSGDVSASDLAVYDATPNISGIVQYAPDGSTGAFYISIYGRNLGPVIGTISVCSDVTGSCSDFQVVYNAQYYLWTDTQINVLLTPLRLDSSGAYDVALTSLGESGGGFVALPGTSQAQSNSRQIQIMWTQLFGLSDVISSSTLNSDGSYTVTLGVDDYITLSGNIQEYFQSCGCADQGLADLLSAWQQAQLQQVASVILGELRMFQWLGIIHAHSTPIKDQAPNSVQTYPSKNGKTVRVFGSDGRAVRDIDYGDQAHTTNPEVHDWSWNSDGIPKRSPGRPPQPGDIPE